MGDTAEKKLVEHLDGKCERWGFNRPEGVSMPHLPARVRAAPDFVANDRFIEAMGLGRAQFLQIKDEKLGALRWWHDLLPVYIFVWDSYRRRKCMISLGAINRLINTPDLCEFGYFDDSKLVFRIPADAVWEAADG